MKKLIVFFMLSFILLACYSVKAENGDTYYFTDTDVSWDDNQFSLLIHIALFCIFLWVAYHIDEMETTGKRKFNFTPFSGGLFIMFAGITFISMNTLLLGVLAGYITAWLMVVGIILLIYGVLKAFYY